LASEEGLEEESLQNFIEQYDYLQREKTEILEDAIMKKKVGLKERRNILKRVLGKLRTIIDTFSWD
jgi:type I restriction enzyme R subunit